MLSRKELLSVIAGLFVRHCRPRPAIPFLQHGMPDQVGHNEEQVEYGGYGGSGIGVKNTGFFTPDIEGKTFGVK